MKTTKWYRGDQKPVRIGVYQRKYTRTIVFCYWDGTHFMAPRTIDQKDGKTELVSMYQNMPWRGVEK